MQVSDFDYSLPDDLIAQEPLHSRGGARMLLLDRSTGAITHTRVSALPDVLSPGDLLVVNNTRVFPARLLGHRVPSGGSVECLLLEQLDGERWDALVHPGQKLRPGERMRFGPEDAGLEAEILERSVYGRRVVRLWTTGPHDVESTVDRIGHIPLPSYIKRPDADSDRERYQTVYASRRGSVAAPTAGLHLTHGILDRTDARAIEHVELTLHVGYGTFKPVRSERVEDHTVDPEAFEIEATAAATVNRALADSRRVVAVGTTTTRALETAVSSAGRVQAGRSVAELFIAPDFDFRVVGGLLTNLHLPRSSLLMLVCAFGGTERVMAAYREAVEQRYRFYSYGDCMLLV